MLKEEASKSRWRARKNPSAWANRPWVCCVGDAALLRWTDCCALLQGQVNRDADWQLGCWGQKVKELWEV
jgi:hypothetical protein